MKIRVISIFTGLLVLFAPLSHAEVEISGYATFAATKGSAKDTNGNNANYVNSLVNKNVQFDKNTHLGLQIFADVSEKIDITAVIHAGGNPDNFNAAAQWLYATYAFSDELSLRMGKYKAPFYMVSDYEDVGYAYPWVRPPLEVYSTNPIEAFSGVNMVYQSSLSDDVSMLLEVFAGSGTHSSSYIPSTTDAPTGAPYNGLGDSTKKGTQISFETPNAKGFNLSFSGEIGTFRVGYFETSVNAAAFGITEQSGSFGGVGLNIDWNNLVIYSEYVVRDTAAALAGAFPDQQAYYATFGYRIDKFLPYVTYAKLAKGKDASPYAQLQSSVALGLRTEVSDTAALKIEVMKVTPEKNSLAGFNTTTSGYGLYNNPVKSGTVVTVSFDVIF